MAVTSELSFLGRDVFFFSKLFVCLSPPTTHTFSLFLCLSLCAHTEKKNTGKHSNSLHISQRHSSASHLWGTACYIPSQRTDHVSNSAHFNTKRIIFLYTHLKFNYEEKKPNKETPRRWKGKAAHVLMILSLCFGEVILFCVF